MTNMEALLKTVDAATHGLNFVYDRLQSGTFGRKQGLIANFAIVAIGLNRGLCCLARYNLNTAAFALERPITETVMRALWIHLCAQEHEIDKFWLTIPVFMGIGSICTRQSILPLVMVPTRTQPGKHGDG